MEIRKIDNNDIKGAKEFITTVFMEFDAPDYSDEGVKEFFDTVVNNNNYMNSLEIYGAFLNNLLIGLIATRNEGNHIALLFVDDAHQRQGIGRKLFQTALVHASSTKLTVNSSPYAKEIYHHLGFEDIDVEQTVKGIRYIPMIYRKCT